MPIPASCFSDHLQRSEKEFSPESSPAVAGLFLSELSDIDFVKSLLFLSLLYRQVDYPLKAVRDFPTSRCSTWSSSHVFLGRTWMLVSHRPLLTCTPRRLARWRMRTERRAGLPAAPVSEGRSFAASPACGTPTIPSGPWLLKRGRPTGPRISLGQF